MGRKSHNLFDNDLNRRELLRLLGLSTVAVVTGCGVQSGEARSRDEVSQAMSNATFVPDVEIVLTAAPDTANILSGAPTRVWRFTGRLIKGPPETLQTLPSSYLGPVIRLRKGQKVRIRFKNQLAEESIVHWHGLEVPESADGHPRFAIGTGREYVSDFEVANRAGTYWYHPHPHGRTGAQVYSGLAGLLIVQDAEEEALELPSGKAELLCVIQDRVFDSSNQLVFHGGSMREMMNGFLGDRVLVNGLPQSTSNVDAGWTRVRLLNGSNARIYKLAWSHDIQFVVIGGDGGLLERPINQRDITLAPAQRVDFLIDLSRLPDGTEVHLDSASYPEADAGRAMMGMMGGTSNAPNGTPLRVMTLRVVAKKESTFVVPERLSTFDSNWTLRSDAKVRNVALAFQRMEWFLGGRTFGMSDVAPEETVDAGSTHLWDFTNLTNRMGVQVAHPMHVHGSQFRVVSRTGASASNALRAGIVDAGWQDTVLVLPGETVRVQKTFTKNPGLYLYHCHILEHEDMGMMRNFRVT